MATQKFQTYKCSVCGNTVEVSKSGEGTLTCCSKAMALMTAPVATNGAASHVIFGVHVTDRAEHGFGVQKVLSEYGTHIKTRVGLHDVHDNYCSPNGLILVELLGDQKKYGDLAGRLESIDGVEVKRMVFDH